MAATMTSLTKYFSLGRTLSIYKGLGWVTIWLPINLETKLWQYHQHFRMNYITLGPMSRGAAFFLLLKFSPDIITISGFYLGNVCSVWAWGSPQMIWQVPRYYYRWRLAAYKVSLRMEKRNSFRYKNKWGRLSRATKRRRKRVQNKTKMFTTCNEVF